MWLLWIVWAGIVTAYAVSLVGPKPAPVVLAPADRAALDTATAASQQAAQQALQAQQTLQALQTGQLFQPGFQGQVAPQTSATASGFLVWRGEVDQDGAHIVYDVLGNPHRVYGA